MLLHEIVSYLAAQGIGTAGTDLFDAMMPNDPDTIVCVYTYGGRVGDYVQEQPTVAYEHPRIQVVARGPREDYLTAYNKAKAAYDALDAVTNLTLSGTHYLRITPLQTPFEMRRDNLERPHVGFNAECFKVPS